MQVKSQPLVIVTVRSPLKSSSRTTISKHNLNPMLPMRVGLTAVEGAAPAELKRQPLKVTGDADGGGAVVVDDEVEMRVDTPMKSPKKAIT